MYWKMKKLSAGLSVELAISIALVTVALFVTLGLFSDNLKEMVTDGNLQKFFLGGDKTTYSAFNRDYSNAGVETLMTGEQGLEQIRKLVNNASDELIDNNIDDPDKLTAKDANAILYYSLIIKAIVGEPHMCIPMKKDSDNKCIMPEIGGYRFAIDMSKYTAVAVEPNSPSIISKPLRQISLKGYATSLANLASTITLNGNGESTLTTKEKYDFITDATIAARPYVDSSVLIINPNSTFKSHDKTIKELVDEIRYNLSDKVKKAYLNCANNADKSGCCERSTATGQCRVGPNEMKDFIQRMNNFHKDLILKDDTDESIVADLISILDEPYAGNTTSSNTYLEIVNNDHYNSPTSCAYLISSLTEIKNSTKINFTIPQCTPSNMSDTGGTADVGNVMLNGWDDILEFFTRGNKNKGKIEPSIQNDYEN